MNFGGDFEVYVSYLSHHGILGQKWGKKNGPPYPLDADDHSRSEKNASWRKSLDKKDRSSCLNSSKGGFHLTSSQKKAIIVGAAAVGVGLAAYGVYKTGALNRDVISSGSSVVSYFEPIESQVTVQSMLDNHFKDLKYDLDKPSADVRKAAEKINELKDKLPSSDVSERIKEVNDSVQQARTIDYLKSLRDKREELLSNATFDVVDDAKKAGFKLKRDGNDSWSDDAITCGKYYDLIKSGDYSQYNNRSRASIAYVMRRFGLDVEPKRVESGFLNPEGSSFNDIMKTFKGSIPEVVKLPSDSSISARTKLMKEIKSMYSDSDHAFGLMLAAKGPKGSSSHAMAFEKIGQNVMLLDPQSGGAGKIPRIFDAITKGELMDSICLVRVDDCGIDPDMLKKYVTNSIK